MSKTNRRVAKKPANPTSPYPPPAEIVLHAAEELGRVLVPPLAHHVARMNLDAVLRHVPCTGAPTIEIERSPNDAVAVFGGYDEPDRVLLAQLVQIVDETMAAHHTS